MQQTTAIHTAATYLDPANIAVVLTPGAQVEVFAFFKKVHHRLRRRLVGRSYENFFHVREK